MTKLTPKEIVSIVLAFTLLICLFPLPYGFFVLIRLISTIVFGYLAYDFYKRGEAAKCVVAALIVLLFQPFAKITFEREIWNVIDIIVALLLFANVIWERVKGITAAAAPPEKSQLFLYSWESPWKCILIQYKIIPFFLLYCKGRQVIFPGQNLAFWLSKVR